MAYIINGKKISDDEIYDEFESIKDHYTRMGETVCCDRDEEFMQFAKDNVVNRTLMEQDSIARFGEVAETAVDQGLAELIAQHGGEQEFYDNTGFNKGDELMIRSKVRSGLIVDRVLAEVLGDEKPPTEDELQQFYEANIENYMTPERVRVSQLFIEPSSHEDAKEVYTKLRGIRESLLSGADFEAAAEEHGTKDKGEIDLGFMAQGETMPEIEAITFSLMDDEVSPIIATHFGFHIFKLTGREEPAPVPMEQIEDLPVHYATEVRETAINGYIDKLKAEGSVEEITEQVQHA